MSEILNVNWRDGSGSYHLLIQRACAFLIALDRRSYAILESGVTNSKGAVLKLDINGIPMVARKATNQKRLVTADARKQSPFLKKILF